MKAIIGVVVGAVAVGTTACAPAESSVREGGAYEVVHGWPIIPSGFTFGRVAGLAVNSRDEVLVFHRASRSYIGHEGPIERPTIMRFDAMSGELLEAFGTDLVMNPHGMAVDDEDNIWLTDSNLHQVFKLSAQGEVLLTVGEAGVRGNDGTHFDGVTDIAVASDGSFYVTDGYGNARVAKFSADGEFLFDWGERGEQPGQFNLPHAITLDSEGRVYVADRSNVRIQVFGPDGSFLSEWKSPELGRPWAIEYAPDGHLYVVDGGDYWSNSQYVSERPDTLPRNRARVHRLDLNGNILDTWGRFGPYDGQFLWPHDVTVTRDGAVFVGDVWLGMRVQKFVVRGR